MKILHEERWTPTPATMAARVFRTNESRPRTPGVHVQAVNQKQGIAAGKLSKSEDSPFEKLTEDVYPLMMALGVGWEEFRVSFYPEDVLVWQPFELEREGILGSPDGWFVDNKFWECKRTTKRLQPIDQLWMYLKQGMSYCAMSRGQMYETRQVLYDILFVCGDYKQPYQPVSTSTLVEFEEREIENWWDIIKNVAPTVQPEGM